MIAEFILSGKRDHLRACPAEDYSILRLKKIIMATSLRNTGTHQVATAIALLFFFSNVFLAQKNNRESGKAYKNVVRFNISNFLLFGPGNIILGYERVVSPSQSFSINIGTAALPSLLSINTDSVNITKQSSKSGFNISADYRFYLRSENKHQAPRGVYIGPYFMYSKSQKDSNWEFVRSNGTDHINTQTNFSVVGAGLELGYQFVFFKRLTLDLVLIGPGMARYDLNAKIDGSIDPDERKQLYQALQQALENKYPGMSIVLEDKEINANGRLGVTSVGYRYLVQIGFRF